MPVKTRTKKQKIDDDRSPLWKFVTEIPLVFGAEILTKLNEFDLKIFYDLCRASREVVKQSKIKLNNKKRYVFWVKSMQELELAWEYYWFGERDRFGNEMTQERFCMLVALTNNLEFLKWAREVKQCAWDKWTISQAAIQDNLQMVKYCVENGCPMDASACANAAEEGHLDVLKYLHEHDCPWDSKTLLVARRDDQIECLNYAIEQKCPGWEQFETEHPEYDLPVYPDYDSLDSSDYEEDFSDEEDEEPDYDSSDSSDYEEDFSDEEDEESEYDSSAEYESFKSLFFSYSKLIEISINTEEKDD